MSDSPHNLCDRWLAMKIAEAEADFRSQLMAHRSALNARGVFNSSENGLGVAKIIVEISKRHSLAIAAELGASFGDVGRFDQAIDGMNQRFNHWRHSYDQAKRRITNFGMVDRAAQPMLDQAQSDIVTIFRTEERRCFSMNLSETETLTIRR